jgi:hypothetical protein
MTDPQLRRTSGEAAAFLLRRICLAAHAAVLLAVLALLLLTAAAVLLVRTVVVRVWVVVSTAARAILRRVRVLRRGSPRAAEHNRRRHRWGSPMLQRWLPAMQQRTLLALRDAAQTERREIGRYLGVTIATTYRTAPGDARPSSAMLLRDIATWRDLAYWVGAGPLAIVTAGGVAVVWLIPPGVIAVPLIDRLMASMDPNAGAALSWWPSSAVDSVLLVGLAVAIALMAPSLTRAAAAAHASLGEALLRPGGHAQLQAELDEQRARRRLAVEAAEGERRRIERDLRDGAQQRLVSLAMNLGMARQKFASDPAAAQELVIDAHAEAKLALGELRALVRGIHPAILTDRGLDAALSALAGRVGVPVDVEVMLEHRPPTAVESAAYFVVAEALTNVARHASATRASVSVVTDGAVEKHISNVFAKLGLAEGDSHNRRVLAVLAYLRAGT